MIKIRIPINKFWLLVFLVFAGLQYDVRFSLAQSILKDSYEGKAQVTVKNDNYVEDDEFNLSLAKMEEEIKPKILQILESLNKNYLKLKKYQIENLECILKSKQLSISKNKNFKKIQSILVDNFKNLQLKGVEPDRVR